MLARMDERIALVAGASGGIGAAVVEALVARGLRVVAHFHRREEAVAQLVARHGGRVVFVSSVAARLPGRGQANYAGTKGALEAFARSLAVELGPKAITVNCVAPGVIETAMSAEIRALAAEQILARTALARYGRPD